MSASIRISARAARVLLTLAELGDPQSADHSGPRAIDELRAALAQTSRASTTRRTLRKPKESKRQAKREARAEVYADVVARALGHCECCRFPTGRWAEVDHFFGRARAESLETCWLLCSGCHRKKTDNQPDAAWWLEAFSTHCSAHGYTEAEAKALARLNFVIARGTP